MSVTEKAVQWALNIAADNTHGYSQNVRWGPSYDCSSLVISAFRHAGIPLAECTYTGNMKFPMMRAGFRNVTDNVELASGALLQRGDVLLNEVHHTAIYIGNGQIVHARSGEGTSDTADNSGNEIRVQNYYNYPWDVVLRYEAEKHTELPAESSAEWPVLRRGSEGSAVAAMQGGLWYSGCDLGADGIDGDFGRETEKAVIHFQTQNGLEMDGICGKETWGRLMKGQRNNA